MVERKWRLLENPMRAANFAVLRAPDVPSMLIETGFLSNPEDAKLFIQPAQREKIAHLIAHEIAEILTSPLFG
jgi:N-acetylmuramoyl-L-alanine amidase